MTRMLRRTLAMAGLISAAIGFPALVHGRPLPNPQEVAEAQEQQALAALTEALLKAQSGEQPIIADLDAILPMLNRPTPLRGFVQFLRAEALARAHREQQARDAVDESIRLLPDFSGPLLLVSNLDAYADRPGRAIDSLIRASRIDPEIVRTIPDYEIRNILHRLQGPEEARYKPLLGARLFEIGWRGEDIALRSELGLGLLESRMTAGDLAGARAAIPQIVSPLDVRHLLVQNRYEPLWADIEQWSGPQQERLWQPFLLELRQRWSDVRSPLLGRPYVHALEAAGKDSELIDTFLPLFAKSLDRQKDYDLLWLVAPLADALARAGRWSDVDALFVRAQHTWPLHSDANALNIWANRGRMSYFHGDFETAVAQLKASIAEGEKRRAETSAQAIAAMHLYLACALHDLGRDSEAIASIPPILGAGMPTTTASLYLCLGRRDAARNVLISALAAEGLRGAVLDFVQKRSTAPMASETGNAFAAAHAALRSDPLLLREIAKHGRVLPDPPSAGAAQV